MKKNHFHNASSIRSFIGAKDFSISRSFYQELGFDEVVISKGFSLFKVNETLSFYLQEYYVKDWADNSMLFLEVEDAYQTQKFLNELNLVRKYEGVRLTKVVENDWGRECFLHDPSGILWHFGTFK